VSVSGTSVQPVKRFSRFQVDSPWRMSTSLYMGMGRVRESREFYNSPPLPLPQRCPTVKFILDNWILILVAVRLGRHAGVADGATRTRRRRVGTSEAVRLINREKGVLIDVCEPAEFAAGHAAGARNVPLGQLEGPRTCPANKTLPLVLMCPTGARAGRAAGLLRKAGYEKAWRCPAAPRPGARPACRSTRSLPDRQAAANGPRQQSFAGPGQSASFRFKPRVPMNAVRMYTTQVCPYCVRAKALLRSAAWSRSTRSASTWTRPA
jgi:rhodanese-related sulfurtransferase